MRLFIFIAVLSAFTFPAEADVNADLSGKFDVGNLQLYIECYGENSPTIVVNAGFGGAGTTDNWQTVISKISVKNRICLYDRANSGQSDSTKEPYNVGVVAKHLHHLLKGADLEPPYLMVGHSYGSYPVRMFNHLYPEDVSAVLLVDPSQYGMFFNGIAKWQPAQETYSAAFEKRRQDELSGWQNPESNGEKLDLKVSAQLIKASDDFADKPFVLLWAKGGIWQGGDAPDTWHPNVWNRMKLMYQTAIEQMHQLSTKQKTVFANTSEHNIYEYEPEAVIKEINYLLTKIQ